MAGKRINMRARKNVTPSINYTDFYSSDVKTFINGDAKQCFTQFFAFKIVHLEKGFIFNMEDDDLDLTDEIRCVITSHKWKKFCRHPNPHNMQIVKELYSYIVYTYQKRLEVIVNCCWKHLMRNT